MSSFKRRSTKQNPIPAGTRILPGSTSTFITSTGIPSLDDILGGGLPLSCSQIVLAPDIHSAYGELVQKYFVAQGLASGQNVWIVSECARDFLEGCMWLPASDTAAPAAALLTAAEEEEETAKDHDTKIKIAWRYEQMKQFQTTVSSSTHTADDFCRVFDLTSRLPASTIDRAIESKQLRIFEVKPDKHPGKDILEAISDALLTSKDAAADAPVPTRICVPTLGFPSWGDVEPQHITYFLYSLRHILRTHPSSCASLSLPPHLCSEKWGGPGWVQKLGWLADASISLTAFSGNPGLTVMFPSHHGFVHIHSLPAPSTLLPPSDKFSTLRGLSSSGENNLAFKCMRKRLIFETLHLDVEGGVGERRTAPSTAAIALEEASHSGHSHDHGAGAGAGGALLEVQVEQVQAKVETVSLAHSAAEAKETPAATTASVKKPKQRKKVAFTSDRPDLYDF